MDPETRGTLVCCLYVFVLFFHCYDCSCGNGKVFGPDCNYMCHCANGEPCDDVTGECKLGCSVDWMGPGCQYRNIAQTGRNRVRVSDHHNEQYAKYAVDDNVTSCTHTGIQTRNDPPWWRLKLEKKHYITGLTFLTKDEYLDQFDNFKIIVGTAPLNSWRNPQGKECYSDRAGNNSNTKFDIMCDTPIFGNHIRIVLRNTSSRLVLCDVRIYGGRNIAIGKSTNASSLEDGNLKYVVNGVVNKNDWTKCARLSSWTEQWWEINLEGHYLIQGYSIHMYANSERRGVRVQVQRQRNDTWTFIGQKHDVANSPYEDVFIPAKVTRIRLIREKSWEKSLFLCEVQLWADCAVDFCGLNCSMPCHCRLKKPLSYTDRLAGACEYGCKPGWTGDRKVCNKECQAGTYGDKCTKDCSGHCANGTVCETTDGHCRQGCEAGWRSSRCHKDCPFGYYGSKCNTTCNCDGHNIECHHVDGSCNVGCSHDNPGGRCANSILPSTGTKVSNVLIGAICVGLVLVLAVIAAAIFIRKKKLNKRQNNVGANINTNGVVETNSIPNEVEYNRIEIAAADIAVDEERGQSQAVVPAEVDVSVCAVGSDPEKNQSLYANITKLAESRTIDITHLGNYMETTPLEEVFEMFQELPYGLLYPVEAACLTQNISKRRYKEIYPYDHCRVVLQNNLDIPHSDYINASFINGFDRKKSYIAAAAPINTSVDDFWRMIWEQKIETVVMVTHLVEAGKVKCLKYWPDVNQSSVYGEFAVTTADEECYADFTVKSFSLTCETMKKQREIKHYHFNAWPDKDVPEGSTGLAHFLQFVRKHDRGKTYPWLVHCSAGVGRTGTFIALDILNTQGLQTGSVNVYQCVSDLRQQRVNMVQTKEQYRFIHEVLFELLALPSKPVSKREYSTVYRQMIQQDPCTNMNDMELQYKQLKLSEHDSCWCCYRNESQRKGSRVTKNSVILAPTKTEYGYTFPAALYLPSYKSQRAFIVSPQPIEDELHVFTRLILQERIGLIIALDTDNKEHSGVPSLFLTKQKSPTKSYKIAVDSVSQHIYYETVTYDINTGNDTFKTDHVVYKDWPIGKAVPRSNESLLQLLQLVENNRSDISYPILVLCSDGLDNSALFCVLLSLLERANLEDEIALTQTIRHFRSMNQHVMTSFQVQLNQTVMPPKDKKCACHICNTMFTNRFNLQRHARVIHSGEKSFKCKTEGCQETFSYNRDLKVHKTKCHAEGQTFKCKSCDKVFIYRSSWKRHRESCLSTEINKVNCTVCGKFFKTSDSLRHHRKYVHEKQNLKGVQCDLCGRIFSRPQELGKHKKSMFHKDDK